MLNSRTSKGMETPVNNGHFEEYEKPLIENGQYIFFARPMYKRRKVSAIRDFPDGCGPFTSMTDPVSNVRIEGCGSANGTIVEEKNDEQLGADALKKHSELQDSLLTETLRQTTDCALHKEKAMVSFPQVDWPTTEDKLAEVTLGQTTDCGLNKENPMVSSHQVDKPAAEDEPAKLTLGQTNDCGSHKEKHVVVDAPTAEDETAKLIIGRTTDCIVNQENPVVSSHQVDKPAAEDEPEKLTLGQTTDCGLIKAKHVVLSNNGNGPTAEDETSKVIIGRTTDCIVNQENPVVSSHQVDGSTAEVEPAKVPLVDMDTIKCDSSYTLKSSSPEGEMAMSGGSRPSSYDNVSGSGAFMVEPITRRYLPCRKVSAVRDFPLLCGRNASCVSKDVCLKEISSLNDKKVGQQNRAGDDNPSSKEAASNVIEVKNNIQDEYGCKRKLVDIIRTDTERNSAERVKKLCAFEPSSEITRPQKNKGEKYATLPEKSNHNQVIINPKVGKKEENRDGVSVDRPSNMKVVLGLMAESECPWRSDKGSSKDVKNEGKRKRETSFAMPNKSKTASEQKPLKKKRQNAASEARGELVIGVKEDCLEPSETNENLQIVLKSNDFEVNVTPSSAHRNFTGDENDANVTRKKVKETLRLFQVISRKLLREVESKPNDRANSKRVDLLAAKMLKDNGKYVNTGKQILGSVPGVEVGDEFQYRVELNLVGLHRQIQGGIDYVKQNGKILATSIVASGGYADDLDNSDVLIYTGQGGNVMNTNKEPEDQKLERGNLALKNSSEEKNPVRVIRGSESADGKCKTYVYDGLYIVESCRQDVGTHGKLVYRFRLRRIPGQPELALKEVKKSKKFKIREGICVDDISHGKERIPICAVNTIDDEKPPPFNYITSMIYSNCSPAPAKGCNCTNGCSELEKCSCVVKNGGEIPFNHNGAIVQAKSLVYECGPNCRCPSTCHNRASQHGIKFQLEIFKTNTRGWGVRSLNSIPSGSFICEYIGELLEDKEAEQRTGNDEYLFDIGSNYTNNTLWDELSTLMPDAQTTSCEVVKDGGFTIDAAEFGNVGRFINHSCSPNLYAQNVLYDHHDTRMPHIMLFAAENIPPLQELTYDYNYAIDQVRDSDGNIKKKYCYCGSVECTGRMY